MAFLWKHPQSKNWFARFYDADGKRRNRSTFILAKESNRKVAEKVAEGYEGAARRKRTSLQVRKVMAELHQEITGEDLPTLTVEQHVAAWLDGKKHEVAPATMAFYKGATGCFMAFLGDRGKVDIAEITRGELVNFRNELSKTRSGSTVNHYVKALRMLFKAADRDGLVLENPTTHLDLVKKTQGRAERRPFTVDELKSVLVEANAEWKSMVMFGLYTGQRLSDVASLTWENIDTEKGEVRLVTRKTGRRMTVPMAEPLKEHVATLPAGDDPAAPLHPEAYKEALAGRSGKLSNQFNAILASLGYREPASRSGDGDGRAAVRKPSVLSFHSLRATAATMMHDAGVPAAVVQELIGHDSEEVHRVYVKMGRESLQGATDKLPKLE